MVRNSFAGYHLADAVLDMGHDLIGVSSRMPRGARTCIFFFLGDADVGRREEVVRDWRKRKRMPRARIAKQPEHEFPLTKAAPACCHSVLDALKTASERRRHALAEGSSGVVVRSLKQVPRQRRNHG